MGAPMSEIFSKVQVITRVSRPRRLRTELLVVNETSISYCATDEASEVGSATATPTSCP